MTKYRLTYVGDDGLEHHVNASSVSVELNDSCKWSDKDDRLSRTSVLRCISPGKSMILPYKDSRDYAYYIAGFKLKEENSKKV